MKLWVRGAVWLFGVSMALGVVSPMGAVAMPSEEPFEIVPGSFQVTTSTRQAGAHGDLTTSFDFHKTGGKTSNDLKNTIVRLPAGFIGNNTAVSTCTVAQLIGNGQGEGKGPQCSPTSQVGVIHLVVTLKKHPIKASFPIFNMEVTSPGIVAEFGFNVYGAVTELLPITVRPGDLGLSVENISLGITEPHEISVTIWGVPWAKSHDAERGEECVHWTPEEKGVSIEPDCINGGKTVKMEPKPYLGNPTYCGSEPFIAELKASSWEQPESWSEAQAAIGPVVECERVPFDPFIEVEPTTDSTESPSGLALTLVVPQSWEKPETISTSYLKDAKITLPVGYTVNPSAGSGLAGCTPQDLGRETYSSLPGEGCPPESKLGTVAIETPVLADKIEGSVYLAQPYDNPFSEPGHPNGSLLALYVVAKVPERGIVVKVAGRVEPNPVTGQIVTTFLDNPQVPFSRFTFRFHQGATSPLVSPPMCGSYTVQTELAPWSAPEEARHLSNSFQIEKGIGGGPCPAGGVPPFEPRVLAGTQNNNAGGYSPFYLRIVRNDGEQEITKFSTTMPPGLTGNLTGIPFCPDTQIEAARRATGVHEIKEPSCPAASEIGHSLVGAGVGSVLAWNPGKVYLAGPYHGAPLSLVSVTSAAVGPFDLGTVLIRFALRINPTTAQVEVDSAGSDPIPHIIDGIVVHVRDIHVYIDRHDFILNPTNCDARSISDTVTGAGANPADPADQASVSVNTRFQAADCQELQFKPVFRVSTAGRTSRRIGASLAAKLVYPRAPLGTQANIASVKVDLPKQLPSRLTTLQKACPDTTFNADPAACPAASRVGEARAVTPILPVPLVGPAYFVSHGGARFPELIIVLQGYGVTIDLHGETFINKRGITSSTFRTVPDQPVTSFELTLPQGPDSALAANGDLCQLTRTSTVRKRIVVKIRGRSHTVIKIIHKKAPGLAMPTAFTAQNGATVRTSTPIAITGCGQKAKKTSHAHKHQ
jgi:hypothetical protein